MKYILSKNVELIFTSHLVKNVALFHKCVTKEAIIYNKGHESETNAS